MVEEDNTPLSVTVTPCDAPLEWQLSLQELPEDASGEGSGEQHDRASCRTSAGRAGRLVKHSHPLEGKSRWIHGGSRTVCDGYEGNGGWPQMTVSSVKSKVRTGRCGD